jgi:hypothetical protein
MMLQPFVSSATISNVYHGANYDLFGPDGHIYGLLKYFNPWLTLLTKQFQLHICNQGFVVD